MQREKGAHKYPRMPVGILGRLSTWVTIERANVGDETLPKAFLLTVVPPSSSGAAAGLPAGLPGFGAGAGLPGLGAGVGAGAGETPNSSTQSEFP